MASETVLYIHPRTQKSACFKASSEREVEAVARWCSSPNFPQVAWNTVDHLVKFEGFNSRVMGTWSLMLMVAKGQITGATSLVRAPVVAEEVSDSVPMGGRAAPKGRDREIRSGLGPELVIPCGSMKLGQLVAPQWEEDAFYYIGPVGFLYKARVIPLIYIC
jgi:hypothetical protein